MVKFIIFLVSVAISLYCLIRCLRDEDLRGEWLEEEYTKKEKIAAVICEVLFVFSWFVKG